MNKHYNVYIQPMFKPPTFGPLKRVSNDRESDRCTVGEQK